eukprot:3357991-Prymnesium_polylepis.2
MTRRFDEARKGAAIVQRACRRGGTCTRGYGLQTAAQRSEWAGRSCAGGDGRGQTFEKFHAKYPKSEEDEAAEPGDVGELGDCGEDGIHEHRHARYSFERAEWSEGTERSDDGVVADGGEEDRQPPERDDHKVELAPSVAQVGVRVEHEAVGEDLREHLDREDDQEDPLAHLYEGLLGCALRVEGRLPRHLGAIATDGEQDEGVE